MWKDFKGFIMRGNVLDLAVAVVIGAAFAAVVKSLVDDVIMPPLGLVMGGADFTDQFLVMRDGIKAPAPYATLADAKAAGAVTMNYGLFINNIIGFLIVALAIFAIVRLASRMKILPPPAANEKPCPFCATNIPLVAKRCPNCTSQL